MSLKGPSHSLVFLSLWTALFFILAAPKTEASVRWKGVQQKRIDQLSRQHAIFSKQSLTYPEIDEVIRILMKTGDYETVKAFEDPAAEEGDNIFIEAVPVRLIQQIVITGNQSLSDSDILENISLHQEDRFSNQKVKKAAEEIKEFYGNSGFFNAVIHVSMKPVENRQMRLEFTIEEGDPCQIHAIEIIVNNPELQKTLTKKISSFKGEEFTSTLASKIESKVYDYLVDHRYLNARFNQHKVEYNEERTKAVLVYQLENPYRYQVSINIEDHDERNRHRLTEPDLRRFLNLDEFDTNIVDPASYMVSKIRQKYIDEGYAHVKVTYELSELHNQFIRKVAIHVSEGPRVKIDIIEVVGRISRPSKYYANFIEENSSDLISSGYYNRKDINLGYENLIVHLKNQGYLKAKTQSDRIEYSKDRRKATVQLTIDEGPLTQVRRIDFDGVEVFPIEQLIDVMNLELNAPLRLNRLEQSIESLVRFYHSRGYLEMQILNRDENLVNYNERGTQADLRFNIHEGPQIRVASIVVDGNTFTDTSVILIETEFEVGDILTSDLIEETIQRLNNTQLFARVDIRTLEHGTKIENRTVIISVTERNPGLWRIGVGVNNEQGLTTRGFTGLSYNNIGGKARGISGRIELESTADINYLFYRATASYIEPYLFRSRTRGRVNFERSQINYNPDEDSDILQVKDTGSVNFLLERDLTSKIKGTWTLWGFEAQRIFEKFNSSPDFDPKTQKIAKIGPSFDFEFRDNPFLPTKGFYARWNALYSDPLLGSSDNIRFWRTESTYTRYTRLGSPKLIWANSVRGGYVRNLSNEPESGVPFNYAFFLGGQSTVRGFGGTNSNERIPSSSEINLTDDGNQLIIEGHSQYYLFKSELRFPIPNLEPLGAVIFYDGGRVIISGTSPVTNEPYENPYRHSIGFGLRVNTPIGPVVLDWAFKLDRRQNERKDRIHFSIGTF